MLNNGDFRIDYTENESVNEAPPQLEQAIEAHSEPEEQVHPEQTAQTAEPPHEPTVGETVSLSDGEYKIVAITADCDTNDEIIVYKNTSTGELKAVKSLEF